MKLAAFACIFGAGVCVATSTTQYVTKIVVGQELRLPIPPGFIPACEQNESIRQRIERMAGANQLLTCLFESDGYAALTAGKAASVSPYVVLASINGPAGQLTASEFKRAIEIAHAKMGDIVEDPSSRKNSQAQMDAADEQMSRPGAEIRRQLASTHMLGFFNSTDTSFSYLQATSVNVTAGGETQSRIEVHAVTSIWLGGHLLLLLVSVDHDDKKAREIVQDITLRWLAAYRSANSRRP